MGGREGGREGRYHMGGSEGYHIYRWADRRRELNEVGNGSWVGID
jgi:hypothetical protein